MASSGNFATLHPSDAAYADLKDGNVRATGTSNSGAGYFQSTFGVSSGKWYAEMYVITMAYSHPSLGLTGGTQVNTLNTNTGMEPNLIWYGGNSSNKLVETSMTNDVWGTYSENESSVSTISATNVVMIALDADNKKLWYGVGGTWYNSGDPAANDGNWAQSWAANPDFIHLSFGSYNLGDLVVNFGQDSTFGGRISAGGNADGNGFGDFKYSPPTGFLALSSGNLPISDDIDPAQTDDDYTAKNFNVVPYTGNQTDDRAVTCDFAPDLVWIKQRVSFTNPNIVTDTVRGATKRLEPNVDIGEATDSDGLKSFTSDGFTLGTNDKYNWTSSHTYVAWCWKAGGAPTADNSAGAGATPTSGSVKIDGSNLGSALAGSIPATRISANTKAGFSIITYTGTGSNATIGHGLSAKPDLIFTKRRSSAQTWGVYHTSLGATKYLALNSNAAAGTDSTFWNDTEPTSTLISLGTEGRVNQNSGTYVAYAWHNVEGYQKFGIYEPNTNSDGPFIYTGFRPKMIFIKMTAAGDGWGVWDTARSTSNVMDDFLRWDSNNAETTGTAYYIDFLSNGFKIRSNNAQINHSSYGPYVYGAWGDVPFKYNNTF